MVTVTVLVLLVWAVTFDVVGGVGGVVGVVCSCVCVYIGVGVRFIVVGVAVDRDILAVCGAVSAEGFVCRFSPNSSGKINTW